MNPTRPVLRWHGGKWLLAPWIIKHFPPHRIYVESFGGAASVLLRKGRARAEIYNDLDQDVVNLFSVLRSDRAGELIEAIRLTPFARREFEDSYKETEDPVERARHLVIRSFQGFGSDGHNPTVRTGFRANSNQSGKTPAREWVNYPEALCSIVERLQGVVVESRCAMECMGQHDGTETLHYVDPPYLPETRSQKSRRGGSLYHAYRHEMNTDGHCRLLVFVKNLKGAVILSGYPSPMYDDALFNWQRVERKALADGARERVEVLWINPMAWAGLGRDLFAEASP